MTSAERPTLDDVEELTVILDALALVARALRHRAHGRHAWASLYLDDADAKLDDNAETEGAES